MEQLYYTSSERLADGQMGFGVLARSAGVTDTDVRAAGMYNRYHRPAHIAADADRAAFPVALSFYRGDDGKCYLTRSSYAGEDYSGRQGNFFAHTVIMSEAELAGLSGAPVLAFDASLWVDASSDNSALPPLEPFPTVQPPVVSAARGFLDADESRMPILPELLQALIEAQTTHRRVLLVCPSTDVLGWLYLLSACLPRRLRLKLTFSTYQREPQDVNAVLVGIDPSDDERYSTTQYRVLDPRSSEGLEGRFGTAAGMLSYLAVDGLDEKLAQIDRFADTFEIEDFDELDGFVAAWMAATSQLGEVSEPILSSARAFFADRAERYPAQAEAAVTGAFQQLSGSGEDSVKREVVRMAASVLISPEQRSRLQSSLAASMTASLEEGTASWLAQLAADPVAGAAVVAAAAETNAASWVSRVILRGDVQELSEVWWVLDAVARAGRDPGDAIWKEIATLACGQGDEELGQALLGTIQALAPRDPARARHLAGLITQPMMLHWPRDVSEFAAALLLATTPDYRQQDVERLVSTLESTPDKGAWISPTLVALLADHEALRALIIAAQGSPKVREGVAQSISRVTGADGAGLRRLLVTTPGCDGLVEAVLQLDMKGGAPAAIIPLWVDRSLGRPLPEQMSLVGTFANWLESGRPRAEDWRPLYDVRDGLADDSELRARCISGYLSTCAIAAVRPEMQRDIAEAQRVTPPARRARLDLIAYLTALSGALGQRMSWQRLFPAPSQSIVSEYATEAEVREFLSAFGGMLAQVNLGKIGKNPNDETARFVYQALGANRFGGLYDAWFARILEGEKPESASAGAYYWIWEMAQTGDAARMASFVEQLKPAIGRDIMKELRDMAASSDRSIPERHRQVFAQVAGSKSSAFRFPFPGKRD